MSKKTNIFEKLHINKNLFVQIVRINMFKVKLKMNIKIDFKLEWSDKLKTKILNI